MAIIKNKTILVSSNDDGIFEIKADEDVFRDNMVFAVPRSIIHDLLMNSKGDFLSNADIKKLGYRVSAVTDILQKFNDDANSEVDTLLVKELEDVASILMSIDDKNLPKDIKVNDIKLQEFIGKKREKKGH